MPSLNKYESDGGPGLREIMGVLMGSQNAAQDRRSFMKAQVLFWLLAATDGHAKNFSVFIGPGGSFRLAPLYDILSVYPLMDGHGLSIRRAKLAMGLTDSHGKIYAIEQIFPQYFFKTAKAVDFDRSEMEGILSEMERGVDGVIERVLRQLPPDFPDSISGAILDGLKKRSQMIADGSWE